MSNVISHTGIIDSIDDGMVRVRIVQHSACSSCKVASYCNSAESKEKIIDVRCANAAMRHIGDNVTVMAAQAVGTKAVIIAFVIPLVLMLTVIAIVMHITGNEPTAALSGMAALVPYYAVLYMLKSKIERQLTFYLKD